MGLLCKGIVAFAVLAVVRGDQQASPPAPQPAPGAPGAPHGAPGAPSAPGAPGAPVALTVLGVPMMDPLNPIAPPMLDPSSSLVMKIFSLVGITKFVQKRYDPIDIPKDLTGKSDKELMEYARKLMKRRTALQRKMTRHIFYSGLLVYWLRHFFSSTYVKAIVISLYWLNTNFREAINADWMIHQKQLSDFILEYVRVKKETLDNLPRSKFAGVDYIQIPYTEKKKATFPVWVKEKNQAIPEESQVKNTWQLVKNWWLR